MKRFFSIFLLLALTAAFFLLSGCSQEEEDTRLSTAESLETNYNMLTSQLENTEDFQAVSDYLKTWADENEIDVKTSNDRYIVLSKAASEGYEDAETFTLHCSIVLDNEEEKEESLETAAAAMTALYRAEHHGTLKAIFTLEASGEVEGAAALGDKQLKGDNFIELVYSGKKKLYNSIAASSEILISRDIKKTSPKYTKAYKLRLVGSPGKSPYLHRGMYPNAIKMIGDLLASCQSSSVLFELASFSGGQASSQYPARAAAVIVLQENDVESFTRRFEASYEKVEEYYEEAEEPFEYTMEEIDVPKRVISHSDTVNIVSLMYTIINGTYLRSDGGEGEIMAASNIGIISTKNENFQVHINARSLENNLMEEMQSVFKTTCGLCDIHYKEISSEPLWFSPEKTPLIQALAEGLDTEPSGELENKSAELFLHRNPKLNLAIWGMDLDSAEKHLSVLFDYMESFGTSQET